MNSKLAEMRNKPIIIFGAFNTLCAEVDRTCRQNISKDIKDTANLINQLEPN